MAKEFAQEQVINDFDTLYQSLIDTHYNPYAYVTPQALEGEYKRLKQALRAPSYTKLQAIKHYQQLVSFINNGHTEIDFPVGPYLNYAEAGGSLFPLDLAFENGKALVRTNYSNHRQINAGAEVVAINHTPIAEILKAIYPLISAEREYFKLAKLEVLSFPRYFWYAFGEQEVYVVDIVQEGKRKRVQVEPVPVFSGFEEKKDEILSAQQILTFYQHTAYLNPGHFSGDEDKYKQFIDNSFDTISHRKVENLIIDLRNNAGGNDSFSDYLVAYLADKPFKWHARFSLRTSQRLKEDTKEHRDLSHPYWQSVMDNENGARYIFDFEPHQPVPESKRFKGNVYVLINRHSHSQASVTAAQIKDYGWAVTVGEETGDYPTLYASQFQYTLPLTQISVKISKGYIVRVNGSENPQGVMPDIPIRDHLLDKNDEILDGVLAHIAERY
ncbi:S41 family peptidase [Alteromonas sediminis]|nr:S41 family peptidase [Alteromonas sediminis]